MGNGSSTKVYNPEECKKDNKNIINDYLLKNDIFDIIHVGANEGQTEIKSVYTFKKNEVNAEDQKKIKFVRTFNKESKIMSFSEVLDFVLTMYCKEISHPYNLSFELVPEINNIKGGKKSKKKNKNKTT